MNDVIVTVVKRTVRYNGEADSVSWCACVKLREGRLLSERSFFSQPYTTRAEAVEEADVWADVLGVELVAGVVADEVTP